MTLEEIKSLLESIQGFTGKVRYGAFPSHTTVTLPRIAFLAVASDNFGADNRVYHRSMRYDVELVTADKEPATEALVEEALDNASIYWEKSEQYIEDEKVFQIVYEIEV